MKKIITIVALALVCVAGNAQRLTILHVNDTHSHLDPVKEGDCGEIERAAFVDSVRVAEGKKKVLYLHAGDFSQGTSYFNVLKGDVEVDCLNEGGVDCVTLGNHEFDNGLDELARRLGNLKMPCVVANYNFEGLAPGKYIKPYTIIKRGGMKIGIIGMLCNIASVVAYETASLVPRAEGTNAEIINKWADLLKNKEKCDMVIVLSHMGYGEDVEVSQQTRNVDLYVGGHSHTLLQNMITKEDLDGKPVQIVQAHCWGHQVGVVKVW